MGMVMPVMQIGVVGMPVHQPDMLVPMRVRLTGRIDVSMLVLVMSIVTMPVFVSRRFVEVIVLVLFGQVQPKAQAHQAARDNQMH
jgi:hypothetical protein